jgi:hypothetical protein
MAIARGLTGISNATAPVVPGPFIVVAVLCEKEYVLIRKNKRNTVNVLSDIC